MKLPSQEQQTRIENIIHSRFFDRTNLYNVYKWLENFEDGEMDDAIDIMEHITYFRESDIVDMLNKIFEEIFKVLNPKDTTMYILPLGEPGKSGDAMMYCAKKTLHNVIIKYEVHFVNYADEIDTSACKSKKNAFVVLLDDIIGSGGSFSDFVNDNKGDKKKDLLPILGDKHIQTLLIAPVILESGKTKINKEFPNVEIKCSETYHKAFEKNKSVFGSYSPMIRLRRFCYKYGAQLLPKYPLGWKNSQALVVFDHATPNNTLPIIWSNRVVKSTKKQWYPLFPRSYNVVGERSFSERTDNNRWVSMLVSVLLRDDKESLGFEERRKLLKNFFSWNSYNLFLILRMLMKKEPNYRIANTLAITADDLETLFKEGEGKLWDNQHKITVEAKKAYDEVEKKISIEKTKSNWLRPQNVDDRHFIYIPGTFKGLK